MNDFAAYLGSWTAFYAALVGATAALMGLIFLAVSLRVELFNRRDVPEPRHIAWQTFLNFFWVFVIGLTLIPSISSLAFGTVLAALSVAGNLSIIRRWYRSRNYLSLNRKLVAFLPLMLCYLGITISGLVAAFANYTALNAIAPILIFVIGVAVYNAWELLFNYQKAPK